MPLKNIAAYIVTAHSTFSTNGNGIIGHLRKCLCIQQTGGADAIAFVVVFVFVALGKEAGA